MKKFFGCIAALFAAATLWAVPAYRGWQTKTQPDGTTIEVRQIGDEFYHYWESKDGQLVLEQEDGTFVVSNEPKPTYEQIKAKRNASSLKSSKPRKAIGKLNKAPRGLLILVQFSNVSFNSGNDNDAFTDMLNKTGYDYNGATGSAVDYFKAQSNNDYNPVFDVVGPVTLSNTRNYYGEQGKINGYQENDMYIADFVIDAVTAAEAAGCDFSQYDADKDGYVDIVYFIYAGKGQAGGGTTETIWPHNWELISALYYGQTHGTSGYYVNADSQGYITSMNIPRFDDKYINNYACSAELRTDGNRSGIGTFCHEFGHVLGLPDYYVTDESASNEDKGYTPGAWTIMDYGSYNNNEMTPPNYSAYDKLFMGWDTPELLSKNAQQNVTLTTDYSSSYQITGTTSAATATTQQRVWYLENRQKTGWDTYLPGHGMLVWEVTYNSSDWTNNEPNNENIGYTIVTANSLSRPYTPCVYNTTATSTSGTTFPGTSNVTSFTPATGCALTNIAENAGIITFKYNGGVNGHNVVVNGTGCTITPSATTVENGTALTATITPTDDTYDFSSLTVQLGSTTLTSGTHYTLSGDKKSLSINASAITGSDSNDLTITAVWTKNRYSYELVSENATVPDDGIVAKNAALNLTITPASGYTLANAACWEVEMGGNTLTYGSDFTYTAGTNTFSIASVTGDVVILVSGGIELTWMANNSPHATTVTVDGTIVLPASNPTPCDDKIFYGWTATENYTHATTAPTLVKAGDDATQSTYYAVFATAEGAESSYQKVTAAPNDWSGNYLIVNETAGVAFNGLSASGATDEVTISDGVIAYSDDLALNEVIIASMTNGYSVRMNSIATNNAGKYLSGSSGSNVMNFGDAAALNTLSYSSGNVTITSNTSVLRYNNAANSGDLFRYYKSSSYSSQQPIQLYRKTGGTSYSDFSTSCVPPTKYAITLNAGDHGALYSSPETEAAAGKTVTITIAPDAHYHLDAISANDGAVALSGTGLTRTFTMPETAVTVAATFAEDDQFTVRFFDNGTELSSADYYLGDTPEVPADPTPGCEDYTFVGWWTAELAADNTAAKSWVSDFTVSQAQDYYAIYSKTVEGGTSRVTEIMNRATTGVSKNSSTYTNWSGKQITSDAIYAGNSAGGNDAIQLRSSNNNSGIITTASGGKIKIIEIKWNSNTASDRTLNVYGKNTAYSTASDLYGDNAGTLLGTIPRASTKLTIEGDYTHIGVRSSSGAMYLDNIQFTWEVSSSTTYYSSSVSCTPTDMETTKANTNAIKFLKDGQLIILRDGKTYNLFGHRLD